MSLLGHGSPHGHFDGPATSPGERTAWRRLLVIVIAVALDAAAATLLVNQGLAGAAVGAASAGLSWILAGRLTGWQPLSAHEAFEDSEHR
jgi:hypothetical protein